MVTVRLRVNAGLLSRSTIGRGLPGRDRFDLFRVRKVYPLYTHLYNTHLNPVDQAVSELLSISGLWLWSR